jgi:VWFA-related protein
MHHSGSLVWFALIGLAGNASSQTTPLRQTDELQSTFSSNLDLVVLNATVRDKKGWFVPGLTQPDFQVSEDRVPQAIRLFRREDIAVTVGLVVDHSGSMRPKLPEVIAAAQTFVTSSRADDHMFVVNFNDTVTLEGFAQPGQLAQAISSKPTMGKTALYDAVNKALEQLKAGGPPKKVLIVISDGGDNASRITLRQVLNEVERSSVLVYTIGVFDETDPEQNKKVLLHLAHVSGGESFFPHELTGIISICQRIARDIRNQYTVGYVSSNTNVQPGVFRSIRLAARAPGMGQLEVRTRTGYIAADSVK